MSIDLDDWCSYARHIGEAGFEIRYLRFPLITKGSPRELGHRMCVPTDDGQLSVEISIGSLTGSSHSILTVFHPRYDDTVRPGPSTTNCTTLFKFSAR
jgi:hypothetical protein